MRRCLLTIVLYIFTFVPGFCACLVNDETPIRYSFPSYEFYKLVGKYAEECANVSGSYAGDASLIGSPDANGGLPATLLGVSVNNIHQLYQRKQLRPLNGLVTRYGKHLHERQLIRRGQDIVAIALTANTQFLVYHNGIFTQENLTVPQSSSQLFDAMQKLSANSAIKKPFAVAYRSGWNVANEFVNLVLADGNQLLDENNKPQINNSKGEAALKQMVAMLSFIPENFDELGPNTVQGAISQGEVAMASVWASSAGAIENPQISRVAGRVKMIPLPGSSIGGKPSSTLWWDGVAISSTSTDLEADKAFRTFIESSDSEMMAEGKDMAIWLTNGYEPNALSKPVLDAIDKGIPEFPASPSMELLMKSLGEVLPEYLKGKKNAVQTLIEVETGYLSAARERGLVN